MKELETVASTVQFSRMATRPPGRPPEYGAYSLFAAIPITVKRATGRECHRYGIEHDALYQVCNFQWHVYHTTPGTGMIFSILMIPRYRYPGIALINNSIIVFYSIFLHIFYRTAPK